MNRQLWSRMPTPIEPDSEDDEEEDDEGDGSNNKETLDSNNSKGNGTTGSSNNNNSSSNGGSNSQSAAQRDFVKVVSEMVSTGYAEGHPAGSLLMEIKGYKFAQNKVSVTYILSLCDVIIQYSNNMSTLAGILQQSTPHSFNIIY